MSTMAAKRFWLMKMFGPFFMFTLLIHGTVDAAVSEILRPTTPRSLAFIPCGDGLCYCTDTMADCSGRLQQSTYIPQFPDNIDVVDLSLNNFSSVILTPHIFQNLTNIKFLRLSDNHFTWVPRHVFQGMIKLEYLILEGNELLEMESLKEIMSVHLQRFEQVNVKGCQLAPPPVHLFQNTSSKVRYLRLDSNPHGGSYHLDAFCDLPHLAGLSLTDCDLMDVTSSCQVHVFQLDLAGNALRTFPATCIGQESLFPSLNQLLLAHNQINTLSSSQICLPFLQFLDLSYNHIRLYPSGAFSSKYFPSLATLHLQNQLSYTEVKGRIENGAFDNPQLQILYLRRNQLDFADRDKIGNDAFKNCFRIQQLDLGSNNLSNVDDARFFELFRHLRILKTLSLSNTRLDSTFSETLPNFTHLEILNVADNRISILPDNAFNSIPLWYLDLQNNRIKSITERTFSPELRQGLTKLVLSFNLLECNCELQWFQHWFQSDLKLFTGILAKLTDYKCSNMPGVTLASFSMADQACLLSRETNLLIIQFSVFVIAALTLTSLVFGFRWHIRLLLYEAFRGRDNLRRQRLQANNFDFDVFVSFSSQDLPWVRQHLMPKLEGELGLRLCVHERDFIVGRHIVDNVVDSVHSSKKILMVFSADFARSEWCQFELSVCLTHVMDFDDAMIVVCVDDVAARGVTSAMKAVMKTTTYIQWQQNDDMQAEAMFWRRLHLAMHEILPP